jgi:hypothetical protein
MRLTLRTLLAYMDDILDPADHEELGKKIEASDFAAELIHRSRDTVRRLRLGAPEVIAGEDDDVLNPDPASDANSVAEYLDNTMPPEHVAEFERVCLDSGMTADMHLAEVTSCHHVLTMVLGEPAEIDPQARRRMYELPQRMESGEKLRIESAHVPVATVEIVTAAPQAAAATASAAVTVPDYTVPDYLRVAANHKGRGRRWATAAVLLLMGGITAYVVSGAFEETQVPQLVADAIDESQFDVQIDTPSQEADDSAEPALEPKDAVAVPFEDQAPLAEQPAADQPASILDEVVADTTTSGIAENSTEPATADNDAQPGIAGTESALDSGSPVTSPGPTENLDPTPLEEPATIGSIPVPSIPGDPLGIEEETTSDEGAEDVPPEPEGPVQLGVYPGNNDVVLRYLPDSNEWLRLSPQSAINAGDTLLVLPKYRTLIGLDNVSLYIFGGTQVTLPAPELADGTGDMRLPLELSYGRLQLNASHRGSRMVLKVGADLREFDLDNSASLVVEVHRVFVPGMDYEKESAVVEVIWYLTSGKATWRNADGNEQNLTSPAIWKTVSGMDTEVQTAADWPKWIEKDDVSSLARRARERLDEELPVGQPVNLRILELNDATDSNRETRSLSAEASLYIGEFEPFIKSLNDSDQDAAWKEHIAAMRQAMARSPHAALKLREDFTSIRGGEAGMDLMAMMRGFTPQQIGTTREELKQGVVLDLVRWLEHDSLDYRVLAIYDLDEIKGSTNLKNYQPDGIPRTRNIAVTKIREMIENNEFLNLP